MNILISATGKFVGLLVVWKKSKYINASLVQVPFNHDSDNQPANFITNIATQRDPWNWYTHVHGWLMFKVNVSKHTIHGSYGPPNIPKSLVNHFFAWGRWEGESHCLVLVLFSCFILSLWRNAYVQHQLIKRIFHLHQLFPWISGANSQRKLAINSWWFQCNLNNKISQMGAFPTSFLANTEKTWNHHTPPR